MATSIPARNTSSSSSSSAARSRLEGGCQCGHVRYRIDPQRIATLYCCHCRECQRQASGAFGMSMKLARIGFELLQGELSHWQRVAESGRVNRASFCPRCGCRIYHDAGEGSPRVSLKAGSLDEIARFTPIGHIWTDSAQPWLRLDPDQLSYPRQPPDYSALEAAYARSNQPPSEAP